MDEAKDGTEGREVRLGGMEGRGEDADDELKGYTTQE